MKIIDPKAIALISAGLAKHVGQENAITAKEIIEKLKVIGCDVNKNSLWNIVRHLRMKRGMFICADAFGYYLPANDKERQHTINSLNSRIKEIEETRDALLRIVSNVSQPELF